MSFFPILLLGMIQGITEFLPISSSGHLLVASKLFEMEQNLLLDVSLHLGTLLALIIYFQKEVVNLLLYAFIFYKEREVEEEIKNLNRNLIIASLPIILIGGIFFLLGWAEIFRRVEIIGFTTIFFGLVLYFADNKKNDNPIKLEDLNVKQSLIIGLFQVLSIIPGTSRAGIVYTGARLFNFSRVGSAKFSMLLSIPVLIIASAIPILELIKNSSYENISYSVLGFFIAFVTAYISIALLLSWLTKYSMKPFVIYRIIFGSIILLYFI